MRTLARPARLAALLLSAVALLTACGTTVSLDEPIESRTWQLVSIRSQPMPLDPDPQRGAHLQFDGTRVNGSGGCNRISGSYQRTGHALRLGQLAATRMACLDGGRSIIETDFLAALQATTQYSLAGGNRLTLLDGGGRTLAVLESR